MLVRRLSEPGFLILYSIVSFATIGWLAYAYVTAPPEPLLWPVHDGAWIGVTVLILFASILLAGSLFGNPALPDPTGRAIPVPEARGVFAITRHPMNWSFALWGICHIGVFPVPSNIMIAAAILVLALFGSALQDRKKERLKPELWPEWERRTSFWPFAALLAGRRRWHEAWPGWLPLLLGLVIWLGATWAHIPISGWHAGIWRWIG
jgi:uncharacterized membrane protein